MDPIAGLEALEKIKFLTLPVLELRPLRRLARSQSLYRLRYHGSYSGRILFRKIMAVYFENHTEHVNLLCEKNAVT
jgi:hypothetical protein